MKKMMSISERTDNVKKAVFFARSSIPRFVIQETGMSAYAALQGIFPALLASLAFVTLTTAVGAGSGAFMGSFAAGIGAVPMGVAGGSVGFKAGLWILNIVGLAFLVEYMGGSLWEAVRHIEAGIKQAWGPKSQYDWVNDGNVFDASEKIAHGVAILIRCILEGIVLYLTVKGASKLPEVVANLKRSKFGEGFAVWVEQNYQQMLSNPKLNRRVGTGAAAAEKPVRVLDHTGVPEQPRPPYAHLNDHPSVGPKKAFTRAQKRNILEENKLKNDGVICSDKSGAQAIQPEQHTKGVSPPSNEAHIDHIEPRSAGGTNSYSNAQVLTREENLSKGAK